MSKFKLLIVDDEIKVLNEIAELVSGLEKYEIFKAPSAEEALSLVEQQEVDIVLLDICMPGVDGMAVLDKLVKIEPKIAIIMVTVMDDVNIAIEAVRKGAWNYILKPIHDKKYFLDVIEKAEFKRTAEKIDWESRKKEQGI